MDKSSFQTLCPGCFLDKGNEPLCPHCGYNENLRRSPLLLDHRRLMDKRYLIGRVLGKPGGFGITYLGWDINLEKKVAIKEYLPSSIAGRDTDRTTVVAHSIEDEQNFKNGIKEFLKEARIIAKFNHPNVVRVHSFFEDNGTGYFAMDYYEGISLQEYLEKKGGKINEKDAIDKMMPILDGLRYVHEKGYLHRDIKPQNIYITKEGEPILLDFGAARLALGEKNRGLTVIMTLGYAPYEQYQRDGKQGPWTDIYACGATIYRMITGKVPPEATERIKHDALEPPINLAPNISDAFNQAIIKSLAVEINDRPQKMREFQDMLFDVITSEQFKSNSQESSPDDNSKTRQEVQIKQKVIPIKLTEPPKIEQEQTPLKSSKKKIVGILLALVIVSVSILIILKINSPKKVAINKFIATTTVFKEVKSETTIKETTTIEAIKKEEAVVPKIETTTSVLKIPETTITTTTVEIKKEEPKVININLKIGDKFEGPNGMIFVYIPSGKFNMGSKDDEIGRKKDENLHSVNISNGFYMQTTEVTVSQWKSIMGTNPSFFQNCNDCPIENVSWNDVQNFITQLNKRESSNKYRLPTEAEWEYSCRAGTDTSFSFGKCLPVAKVNYDASDNLPGCPKGKSYGKTSKAAKYTPNAWGLYDMHGNVWEWCQDWYGDYPNIAITDPKGSSSGTVRVYRGGSWFDGSKTCRSANRESGTPDYKYSYLGFRLIKDF